MSSSADSAADQTHEMMKDVADHWGLAWASCGSSRACGFEALAIG